METPCKDAIRIQPGEAKAKWLEQGIVYRIVVKTWRISKSNELRILRDIQNLLQFEPASSEEGGEKT